MEATFNGDSSESNQDETWDDCGAHVCEMSKVDSLPWWVSLLAT